MKLKPQQLCVRSFATAGAILLGADAFLHAFLGWLKVYVLWYNPMTLALYMTMFPGVGPSAGGAVIALAWGGFAGALLGSLFAALHNWAWKKYFCGKKR